MSSKPSVDEIRRDVARIEKLTDSHAALKLLDVFDTPALANPSHPYKDYNQYWHAIDDKACLRINKTWGVGLWLMKTIKDKTIRDASIAKLKSDIYAAIKAASTPPLPTAVPSNKPAPAAAQVDSNKPAPAPVQLDSKKAQPESKEAKEEEKPKPKNDKHKPETAEEKPSKKKQKAESKDPEISIYAALTGNAKTARLNQVIMAATFSITLNEYDKIGSVVGMLAEKVTALFYGTAFNCSNLLELVLGNEKCTVDREARAFFTEPDYISDVQKFLISLGDNGGKSCGLKMFRRYSDKDWTSLKRHNQKMLKKYPALTQAWLDANGWKAKLFFYWIAYLWLVGLETSYCRFLKAESGIQVANRDICADIKRFLKDDKDSLAECKKKNKPTQDRRLPFAEFRLKEMLSRLQQATRKASQETAIQALQSLAPASSSSSSASSASALASESDNEEPDNDDELMSSSSSSSSSSFTFHSLDSDEEKETKSDFPVLDPTPLSLRMEAPPPHNQHIASVIPFDHAQPAPLPQLHPLHRSFTMDLPKKNDVEMPDAQSVDLRAPPPSIDELEFDPLSELPPLTGSQDPNSIT